MMFVFAVFLLTFYSALAQRRICSGDNDPVLCLSENNGELSFSSVEDSPFWNFEFEVPTSVCLTEDNSTCLLVQQQEIGLSSVESSEFTLLLTSLDAGETAFFQFQLVADNTLCLDNTPNVVICVNIAEKAFDQAEDGEVDQSFFFLADGEEPPNLGNNNNNNNDNNNNDDNDIAVGILIFQLMLPLGFIAVVIATVYKYDLLPESIKDGYRKAFRKPDVSKKDLEEIAAQAKEVQLQNKEREQREMNAVL